MQKVFRFSSVAKSFHFDRSKWSKKVECESVKVQGWVQPVGYVKTCFMKETTSIEAPGAVISTRDETIEGLILSWNEKIFFFPDDIFVAFSNLKGISAWGCLVKEISKRNFNGLIELKYLNLEKNQIETINNGTFKGLVNLEELNLGKQNLFPVLHFQFQFCRFSSKQNKVHFWWSFSRPQKIETSRFAFNRLHRWILWINENGSAAKNRKQKMRI